MLTLEIAPSARPQTDAPFGEWMIGGVPLRTWIDAQKGDNALWDVVGLPPDVRLAKRMIDVLRRRAEPELSSGRAVLYRCPECFELGCGVFAARVTREGDNIVWSDFAWEADGEPVPPFGDGDHSALPELRFSATQYDDVLRDVVVSAASPGS